MRRSYNRGLALIAVAGMLLAGCGDDQAQEAADTASPEAQAGTEQTGTEPPGPEQPGTEAMEDPNDDVEDGVYRGNGVVLPVPEGWSLNQQAFAQGIVAAVSEDQTQQMTAQAVDTEAMQAAGQDMGLDSLVDGVRQQIQQEPEVDEDVDLSGAERAHQLTYLELPAQQEGGQTSSATIVIAEDGNGLVGEFAFSATADSYDEEVAKLLVEQAGFDPDSEPPALPQPPQQPAPQDDGSTEGTDGSGEAGSTEDGADKATTEEETSSEG